MPQVRTKWRAIEKGGLKSWSSSQEWPSWPTSRIQQITINPSYKKQSVDWQIPQVHATYRGTRSRTDAPLDCYELAVLHFLNFHIFQVKDNTIVHV